MSELEFRSATLGEVSFPKRQIELVVMPYETPTVVGYKGRLITEVCSRGAFDGVERRSSRVRVNVDHRLEVEKTIGRALALHPSRHEGLVAEIKIVRGPLGDHALELADEDNIGASAGFALLRDEATGRVYPDAEVWETRSSRRLNRLWLDHIALTPDPAYDGTQVLAVRSADELPSPEATTPIKDRLEIERLREEYARIDARYSLNQH